MKAKFNAAKSKRDKAQIALDSAQFQLDQCLLPKKEKAACGHDMPGHVRAKYSCGHWDYTCQEAKHQLRECPKDSIGRVMSTPLRYIKIIRRRRQHRQHR
ncbi:hypothetical protein F4X88_14380 [Candidatus Poribacteria bacterium]|nr:hypothetical protein [Candidatus Poribacteria bacterium]MYA57477.1 hypothetical protein [Candidatus Poribacteria bacterium]